MPSNARSLSACDGHQIWKIEQHCEKIEPGCYRAGSDYPVNRLGVQSVSEGFTGLEFAAGIPGTVGGAVYMNAGANGQETVGAVESIEIITTKGEYKTIKRRDLNFSYRSSPFQDMNDLAAITAVTFRLKVSQSAKKKQQEYLKRLTIALLVFLLYMGTEEELALHKKSNAEPILEEFIPLKKSCKDEQSDRVEVDSTKKDISCRDKMNWMSSVQLWNSDSDLNNKLTLKLDNSKKRAAAEEVKQPAKDNLFQSIKIRTVVPLKGYCCQHALHYQSKKAHLQLANKDRWFSSYG
ncbi:UDP-n-acetylenolpyruvoylglucosamine reductase [Phtheirospermum japonicum]|uniref:UDP-n-acetylenolpyruvoylglucosamine reductase n=1 Tax=Phtheirospermum japonicum TaxID=374723 RepID=A0A830BZ31_9LAMI|nr:UDP-n-acetylenolpyruvoylglucosamine reductase [Phtheirospermum japonicum]